MVSRRINTDVHVSRSALGLKSANSDFLDVILTLRENYLVQ